MAAAALIFDLDGTVWDSRPWFASLLADGDGGSRTKTLEALRTGSPAAKLLKGAGMTPASFRNRCTVGDKVELYPEVETTFRQLHDSNVALGAVTNLPDWIAAPMLAALELDQMLGSVVTFGRTRRRKPAPDPLLLCCRELDVPSDESWYIGDSTGDCEAARAGGLSFAWADWGYGDAAPEGSDQVLAAFVEVLDL